MKIVFCLYFRQNWIDLRQTKTKMISGRFYTYRQIHFISENASFLRYLAVIIRGCMSHRPPGRVPVGLGLASLGYYSTRRVALNDNKFLHINIVW